MKKPIEVEPKLIEPNTPISYPNGTGVRCRIISEDNYATLYNKAYMWDNYKEENNINVYDQPSLTKSINSLNESWNKFVSEIKEAFNL